MVIAAFWNAHRELFRHVVRIDRGGLVPVNFVFLLMIVLLPFVTRVIGADGDHQIGVVLYAATGWGWAGWGWAAGWTPGVTRKRERLAGSHGECDAGAAMSTMLTSA